MNDGARSIIVQSRVDEFEVHMARVFETPQIGDIYRIGNKRYPIERVEWLEKKLPDLGDTPYASQIYVVGRAL